MVTSQMEKELSNQSSRAMYSVLSKGRALNLSLDNYIVRILWQNDCTSSYLPSEVWGFGSNDALEGTQLMCCKYILGLKKSTPTCLLYKERGRYPVDIRIKLV